MSRTMPEERFTRDGSPHTPFDEDSTKADFETDSLRPHLSTNDRPRHIINSRRVQLWGSITLVGLVLLLNVALLVIARLPSRPHNSEIARLYSGTCATSNSLTTVLHLLINIFSTLMITGSTVFMQQLGSPTRAQLDRAHAQGKRLHIGVVSFRNLKSLPIWRGLCWLLLGLTAIPLHLFYNATIFQSVTAYDYVIYYVAPNIFDLSTSQIEALTEAPPFQPPDDASEQALYATRMAGLIAEREKLEFLTPSDCIRKYSGDFMTTRRDLIIVMRQDNYSTPWLSVDSSGPHFGPSWITDGPYEPSLATVLANANDWDPEDLSWAYSGTVGYCLSEVLQDSCLISVNETLLYVVIACNAVKLLTMLISARSLLRRPVITTVGDALSSYLIEPDQHSGTSAIQHARTNLRSRKRPRAQQEQDEPVRTPRKPYCATKHTRFSAIPRSLWFMVSFLTLLGLAIGLGLTTRGILCRSLTLGHAVTEGFGKVTMDNRIFNDHISSVLSLTGNAAIANIPQIFVALAFLFYNPLLVMLNVNESWLAMCLRRKNLRVRAPLGAQKGAYLLGLPLRMALPWMLVSILLHWLISQSIFLVRVRVMDLKSNYSAFESILNVGFSFLPCFLTAILAFCIFLTTMIIGFTRYPRATRGYPLIGTDSLKISAVCHPPEPMTIEDTQKKLKFGVVSYDPITGVGHCSLTHKEPCEPLVPGQEYD